MSDKRMPEKKKQNQSGAHGAKSEKPKAEVFKPKEEPKNKVTKPSGPMINKSDNKSKRKP